MFGKLSASAKKNKSFDLTGKALLAFTTVDHQIPMRLTLGRYKPHDVSVHANVYCSPDTMVSKTKRIELHLTVTSYQVLSGR
jgi:hypothetical protein